MSDSIAVPLPTPPFSLIDVHFARLIEKLSGGNNPEIALAAALVSCLRAQGHICLNLVQFSARPVLSENGEFPFHLPPLAGWLERLRSAPTVGKPGEFRPLILDENGRLYLHRYWEYEQNVAMKIRERLGPAPFDAALLQRGLARLFPATDGEVNWQKVAAFTAVTMKFCVISGGPGTGKTFTILNILALLVEQANGHPFRIALAAPTGKAAARLQETIEKARQALDCPEGTKAALPSSVSTIHRLLGTIPDSPYFRRSADDPLAADAVVVDEASMVDLALMSKLLDALPPRARLILLGDKDQLASVEAGSVLGDICGSTQNNFSQSFADTYGKISGETLPDVNPTAAQPLRDHIVLLQKNYRFGDASPIYSLSKAVRDGDASLARQILQSSNTLSWNGSHRYSEQEFRRLIVAGYKNYLEAENAAEALEKLNQFRILAALRNGPFGVAALNHKVEAVLRGEGLIDHTARWYFGRPLMITQNDYNLGLFNGDIGIIVADPETGAPHASFPAPNGEIRKILPQRLPEHETVFAMTVHKSQGSEFDDVLVVLPDIDSPVLGRELIYTAITRARRHVTLLADECIFDLSLSRQSQRNSGLPDLLWSDKTEACPNR